MEDSHRARPAPPRAADAQQPQVLLTLPPQSRSGNETGFNEAFDLLVKKDMLPGVSLDPALAYRTGSVRWAREGHRHRDVGRFTVLHAAASLGRPESLGRLLDAAVGAPGHMRNAAGKNGADPADGNGWTPLHDAAVMGHAACARLLIMRGAALDAKTTSERTPLHLAAGEGHVDCARALVDGGADSDARDNGRNTPLHLAVKNRHVACARLLIEAGAPVEARDCIGSTPLHQAAERGYPECARALMEGGADPNALDDNERTPLHWAAFYGHPEVAGVLLEAGADATVRDRTRKTPRDNARGRFDFELVLTQAEEARKNKKSGPGMMQGQQHQQQGQQQGQHGQGQQQHQGNIHGSPASVRSAHQQNPLSSPGPMHGSSNNSGAPPTPSNSGSSIIPNSLGGTGGVNTPGGSKTMFDEVPLGLRSPGPVGHMQYSQQQQQQSSSQQQLQHTLSPQQQRYASYSSSPQPSSHMNHGVIGKLNNGGNNANSSSSGSPALGSASSQQTVQLSDVGNFSGFLGALGGLHDMWSPSSPLSTGHSSSQMGGGGGGGGGGGNGSGQGGNSGGGSSLLLGPSLNPNSSNIILNNSGNSNASIKSGSNSAPGSPLKSVGPSAIGTAPSTASPNIPPVSGMGMSMGNAGSPYKNSNLGKNGPDPLQVGPFIQVAPAVPDPEHPIVLMHREGSRIPVQIIQETNDALSIRFCSFGLAIRSTSQDGLRVTLDFILDDPLRARALHFEAADSGPGWTTVVVVLPGSFDPLSPRVSTAPGMIRLDIKRHSNQSALLGGGMLGPPGSLMGPSLGNQGGGMGLGMGGGVGGGGGGGGGNAGNSGNTGGLRRMDVFGDFSSSS